MVAKTFRALLSAAVVMLVSCQTIVPSTGNGGDADAANKQTQTVTDAIERKRSETEVTGAETAAPRTVTGTESSEPAVEPAKNTQSTPPAKSIVEPSPEQVVLRLQQDALKLQSEGRWQEAELVLERALRIDADKVDVYHQLATVRMGQERFAEAEQIALKGLTLTDQTPKYKASLWEVIAQCRSAMSDIKGAKEARSEMLKWMAYE